MACEWTKKHYFDTLFKAKDLGYQIKKVCDYSSEDKKVILLRHDIDFSLDYAHKLATYENRFDITSSYYVYLHSETYNALAPKSMEIIKKIKKLDHEIGLHYDSRYAVPCEDLLLQGKISSITQHNPSMTEKPFWVTDLPLLNPSDLPIKYISDSGRNWRSGCFCQWIGKEESKLHILTHPIWWVGKGNSRAEIVYNMIQDQKINIDSAHDNIKQMLKDYNEEIGIEVI